MIGLGVGVGVGVGKPYEFILLRLQSILNPALISIEHSLNLIPNLIPGRRASIVPVELAVVNVMVPRILKGPATMPGVPFQWKHKKAFEGKPYHP